jgi:hypothetical protein
MSRRAFRLDSLPIDENILCGQASLPYKSSTDSSLSGEVMIARLKHLWATRRIPFLMFFGSLAIALWFAGSFVADLIYWNDPRHKNQALEPWMTPRYIQHSYGLRPKTVADVLGIDHPFPHRMRMSDIVASTGQTYEALTEELRTQAEAERAERKAQHDE